jgi:hypothetical protein
MNLPPLVEKLAAVGYDEWKWIVLAEPAALDENPGRAATSAAVTLATIGAYCDARRSGSTHEPALVLAQQKQRAARKALGYTHPQ